MTSTPVAGAESSHELETPGAAAGDYDPLPAVIRNSRHPLIPFAYRPRRSIRDAFRHIVTSTGRRAIAVLPSGAMLIAPSPAAEWRRPQFRARLLVTALAAAAVIFLSVAVLWQRDGRMPDFRNFEAGTERKQAFFSFLLPLVTAENERILADRERLLAIAADDAPGWIARRWVRELARDYVEDPGEMAYEDLRDVLLRRVDAVPAAMALAQAAKESGWGTSRFARNGNNLFGEWCYTPGCGIVPRARARGRRHEVRAFPSPRQSVRSYIANINTHRGYRELRRERARLRAAGRTVTALALVPHLHAYSERGADYVADIRRMIVSNELERRTGAGHEAVR